MTADVAGHPLHTCVTFSRSTGAASFQREATEARLDRFKSCEPALREDPVERTIVANFDTRRDAETAVEHLVQEHGVDRTDIFIRSPGTANTAGVRPAGADVESGHPGVEKHGEPALSGPIEVSVDCDTSRSTIVRSALEKAGATQLRTE
jgi:hypothetical protein